MSAGGSIALAVEGLSVSFDGFKAVDDVSLYVERSELRVVIGPNGAGKTTVLDLICGKTRASAGSVRFKDRELTRLSEHQIVRAGVGRKFQTPSIYDNLSVFENLELSHPAGRRVWSALAFRRSPEVLEKIHAVAEQIRLVDDLGTESGLLSHGQKQWLEIGMLLMQDPELMMLDEPVAGMGPRERELTAELLKQICSGRSVIVIEHDMEFVNEIAHRVTVLHRGRVLKEGSMKSIQADPEVAEVYLGSTPEPGGRAQCSTSTD